MTTDCLVLQCERAQRSQPNAYPEPGDSVRTDTDVAAERLEQLRAGHDVEDASKPDHRVLAPRVRTHIPVTD